MYVFITLQHNFVNIGNCLLNVVFILQYKIKNILIDLIRISS